MTAPTPLQKQYDAILAWDRSRHLKIPPLRKDIAAKFGITLETFSKILRNREAVMERAEYEGLPSLNSSPILTVRKEDNQFTTGHTVLATEKTVNHGLQTVLVIPDLHCPWEHPDALEFLKAVRRAYKPTKIVCLGDEVDFHNYSKWPKDPDVMSAGQELKEAIEHLIPFYLEFPEVQVCVSNHTIRPQKMMKLSGLPAAFFPRYSTLLNAPDGWSWHEHIIIDNVRYIHGDQGKAGQKGWTSNSEVYHQSTVVGHWHSKAGVFYDSAMFNMNTGCLIWPPAPPFDYGKNSHKKPNIGCGLVMGGKEAHFIPLQTDINGRWTGKLHG